VQQQKREAELRALDARALQLRLESIEDYGAYGKDVVVTEDIP
jgi:hypothetical protein